jgi:hypothetical protein
MNLRVVVMIEAENKDVQEYIMILIYGKDIS